MKKEIVLQSPRSISNRDLFAQLAENRLVRRLARHYSHLLEENITPARTLRLVHAQISVFLLLCAAHVSVPALMLLAVWSAAAVYSCRR